MNSGTLVDRNLEAGRGAKVAVRCAGEELTYAQLHDRICRAGNALRELGVRREDRVLMILDDAFAFPTVFLGAMRMGAVPVPVSFLDTLDNFRHYLRDSYVPYTCETFAREILAIVESDVTFSSTKLYHAYGLGDNLTFPYWAGATTVLRPGRADPKGLLETARANQVTLFFSVPTLYGAMVNLPDAAEHDLSSVWCKGRLRRYEYPHFIDFVDELPKTPTGKIQRYKLRELP